MCISKARKFFIKYFSPYTHFYIQTLIDVILKTYNTGVFRTYFLYKYKISVFIKKTKYYANERFEGLEEYSLEKIKTSICYLNIE